MGNDDRALAAYKIICDQIIKEDNLINQRVTWGVAINGALLTLIALMLTSTKDIPKIIPIAGFISAALALLAIWICRITYRAVRKAREQILHIKNVYIGEWKDTIEGEFKLPRPLWIEEDASNVIQAPKDLKAAEAEQLFIAIGALWIAVLTLALIGMAP
jgi:hypothetical protein